MYITNFQEELEWGCSLTATIKPVIKKKKIKQARTQLPSLQNISEIKCSDRVIIMTRFFGYEA